MKTPLEPREDKAPAKPTYVFGVVCDDTSPKVRAYVVKDVLILATAAKHAGSDPFVYCEHEDLWPALSLTGIARTGNANSVTYWRLYVTTIESTLEPPTHTEFPQSRILVKPGKATIPGLMTNTEFPAKLNYTDPVAIPDTMPKNPPRHSDGNPFQTDF